jgi:transposase
MKTPAIGIDIAQHSFVAALWFDSRRHSKATFANHVGGFRRLQRWLQKHFVAGARVGLESTNTYAEALAEWLHQAGHEVYLLNPERTACYARSVGQLNKTDPADAVTIAAFVAHHELTPWHPPSPEQKKLRSLTRVRRQLVACQKDLANQLRTADAVARPFLEAMVERARQQVLALDHDIAAHLRSCPQLAQQVRRLRTVKGVGLLTAATLLAELPTITPHSDPRAICAWAGLTPRRWQSGPTERPSRLSRKGNAFVRDCLYMPALVAKRFNPLFRDFAARLAAKGKSTPAILGAIAHKMLRILVGLLRSNRDFDPNWVFQKS